MPCADGVELMARVWQPAGQGPWPVLLMRQPYGRAIASTVTYAHPAWYASHGFLVVVQDVRGSGDSQGCFAGFAQEARDGAQTVRWARHLPGSNGRLGTYGFSYQGLTQLLGDDPDALPDALAPAMCGLDERHHWAVSGQAHWWALGLAWGLQLAAQQCRRRGDHAGWLQIRSSLESQRFLQEGLELLERLDPSSMVLGWLQRDPGEAWGWVRHRPQPALLARPLLLIGGWYDPHLGGILDLYQHALALGGSPCLRIGAWNHLNWQGGLDAELLAFFQRHLGAPLYTGTPAAPTARPTAGPPARNLDGTVHLQCLTTARWQHPAPGALTGQTGTAGQPRPCWGLASTGLAAIRSDDGVLHPGQPGRGQLTLVHDPWRPAPAIGGHLGLDAGPCDRRTIDARTDVACFTTAPLQAPLELLGCPHLSLAVAADQPGFDLVVTLAVLQPGAAVRQLCMGVARFRGAACQRKVMRSVALQPLLARLAPGECLRLSLAAAAWPQIAVNPGDGSVPRGPAGPAHRVITLSLDLLAAELRLEPLLDPTRGAN